MNEQPASSINSNTVHKSIIVHCEVETAFRVWTQQINRWWPKSHSRSHDPNTTVMLEPWLGGRLYERTAQGVEHEWGEVTAWEPPRHFAYNWYLGSGPSQPTHVDVHFVSEEPKTTRVNVSHRGPELIGELWSRNRSIYEASWETVLAAFVNWQNSSAGPRP